LIYNSDSNYVPDYKVVIVTKRKAQGYTLTRLSVMLTSVYPSNNATREQLAGRINRLGQKDRAYWYIDNNHGESQQCKVFISGITGDG